MLEMFVVTPPGGVPPALGGEIPEDPVARKARRKGNKHPAINTQDTYTFSFHTAYVLHPIA